MISEILKPATPSHKKIEALMAAPGMANNDFAQSLVSQFVKKGGLSDRQWFWVEKLTGEAKPAAAPKAAIHAPGVWNAFQSSANMEADWPQVQLSAGTLARVKLLLCKGQKGPYLKLSHTTAAKPRSGDWAYVGIALPTDEVRPVKGGGAAFDEALESVTDFGEDMLEALKAFGLATGVCACCGRTLTDPESVERGIGPVCFGRLFKGLPK